MRTTGLIATAALFVLGCAHTPQHPGERADLIQAARQTVIQMEQQDATLRPLLAQSAGYVVFPQVGSGGFVVGGGGGAGVLFERGRAANFAELTHLEAGALVGGQRYAEIVVLKSPQAVQSLRAGRLDLSARASAVILRSGAAANANFDKGVAVIVKPLRGAMVNASIRGQRVRLTL